MDFVDIGEKMSSPQMEKYPNRFFDLFLEQKTSIWVIFLNAYRYIFSVCIQFFVVERYN